MSHPLTIPDGATGYRLQQRKRAVLRWCWAHGYIEQNVAGKGIEGALPAMLAVKAHFRAPPYPEVAAALETVDGSKASVAARLCFRFLVLTAVRSGEARGALWSEMDGEAREWRIPGERTKTGAPHRVSLSPGAMDVLDRARALDDRSGLAAEVSAFDTADSVGQCGLSNLSRGPRVGAPVGGTPTGTREPSHLTAGRDAPLRPPCVRRDAPLPRLRVHLGPTRGATAGASEFAVVAPQLCG